MYMLRLVFLTLYLCLSYNLQAQNSDSLALEIGAKLQGATGSFQPLWSKANLFGISSDKSFDQITWVGAFKRDEVSNLRFLSSEYHPLLVTYGATIFNSDNYKRLVLQQVFAELKHNKLLIRAGRYQDLADDLDPELSSGSLGTSGNALPVPKITGAIYDYTDIPFTNGKLQFKGSIGHGWLGSNRYMQSFLHEKTLYGRLNLNKVKLYGGVQHYTEWGGRRQSENIYLDRSFKGFLDVLFVLESNDGSLPLQEQVQGTRPNKAGDQRGVLELGFFYENKQIQIHGYNQTPFESGTGIDIRNIDRLLGVHIKFKDEYALLKDLVIEFIYTKQMEKFGKEMQSYYNNGALKTGWEYENNVIGSPLFTNRWQGSNYLPIEPFDWKGTKGIVGNSNIINNRIVGGNLASRWVFFDNWGGRIKLTPVINYGARNFEKYYGNGNGLFQCYSLFEGYYQTGPWRYSLGIATDFGRLYNNTGTSIGVKYVFTKKTSI